MKYLVLILSLIILTTSCMTHRHTIGDGPVGRKGKTEVHSRAKQGYLFWGLVPLGRPDPAAPSHGNYQIKTGANIGDAILTTLTLGIVSFRTIRILVYKAEEVYDDAYQRGQKVLIKKGKDNFSGEIADLDREKGKVTVNYLNIYGEQKTSTQNVDDVSPLSDEQYTANMTAWKAEIEKYKYSSGEFATWTSQNKSLFGVIKTLDDKAHRASIEYINIFGEPKIAKVPYLDIAIIPATEHEKLSSNWNQEIAKYKFEVGEMVDWYNATTKKQMTGEIANLDDKMHVADVKYTDEKGKERVVKKLYLKLIKKA